MKNQPKLMILAIVLVVVVVVVLIIIQAQPRHSPIDIPDGATIYTDEEANLLFIEHYGLTSLQQQEVYLYDDDIYIAFWFAKDAGNFEVDSARSFVITRFIGDHYGILGPSPYARLVNEDDGSDLEWQHVICNIYVGDELVSHDEYDENDQPLP